MSEPSVVDLLVAASAVITPLLVVFFGAILTHRQSRNRLLLEARFEYYKDLAPDLNRLMCYLTYIGEWRDISPPEVVYLKRKIDKVFYVAAPLFSKQVGQRYRELMDLSFRTFGFWGQDARILSGPGRRRESWVRADPWVKEWDDYFALREDEVITPESLRAYRLAYDKLVAALVTDLSLSRARPEYTTPSVSLNASTTRNTAT